MKNFFRKIKNFCIKNPIGTVLILLCIVTVLVSSILMATLIPHSHLTKIEIVTPPDKTQYIEGEDVNTQGMVVKAYYGKKGRIVTDYTLDKEQLSLNDKEIKVSYADRGTVKSAAFAVSVVKKDILSIEITKMPNKLKYIEHSLFQPDGIEVTANYNNGKSETVEGWEYDKKGKLQIDDTLVTISYGGKTVSLSIEIEAKVLQSLYIKKSPDKLSYFEGEYFDFLGVELYAKYSNAQDELVRDWDYDKTSLLTLSDTSVEFSYTLHGVEKTARVEITVMSAPNVNKDEEFVQEVLNLLPPIDGMTAQNLPSINYALSLLDRLAQPSQEILEIKQSLEEKRNEIAQSIPPEEEKSYSVTYSVSNGLNFEDINWGNNPIKYTAGDGEVVLSPAVSQIAAEQGYVFNGWFLNGQKIDSLLNLRADVNVFADFQLTATLTVEFLDYYTGSVLLEQEGVERTGAYDLQAANIDFVIYSTCSRLPIAYFDGNRTKISSADLGKGKKVAIYVVTSQARELHIDGSRGASVGWTFDFSVDESQFQTSKMPQVGNVFVIPIGATVKIVSMNANIDDILVDGVSKGTNLNNTVVQAEFEVTEGDYALSVTFKTKLSDITTLSFLGYNQHSIVYPAGWDGVIASADLDTLKFVYDEEGINYVNRYTIDGDVYYFDDLVRYCFQGDTQIYVDRVRNSFSFKVYYVGGVESFDELVGKQTLQDAFSMLPEEALQIFNAILKDGRLYADSQKSQSISMQDILAKILRSDITIYSDWERPSEPQPVFDDVDYGGCDFVNTWTAVFSKEADVLSSELTLTADGLYSYRTFVNGEPSADVRGVYRIEDGKVALKTAQFNQPYLLFQKEDLAIDIEFAKDGLMRVNFIDIRAAEMTVFEHTMTCGNVRFVNYTNMDFIGTYELNGSKIELRENGTAVIVYDNQSFATNYRVDKDGKLIIFDNGDLGTGEIIGIWENS